MVYAKLKGRKIEKKVGRPCICCDILNEMRLQTYSWYNASKTNEKN